MKKKNFCAGCVSLRPRRFTSPEDFFDCLQVFKKALDGGEFECVSANFELERPKNAEGFWQDDILEYTIRCKRCGRAFCCVCDTYHGHGRLKIGK